MTLPSLHLLLQSLQRFRWIDLTHAFDPTIPHCHMFDPEDRKTLYDHHPRRGVKGSGFLAHEYRLVGQWGTHVDPPAHFVDGLRYLDEVPVTEMILPLVVIDVRSSVAKNPDYCVHVDDVHQWERHHGRVPIDSFVALLTGWGQRWPDLQAMRNADASGVFHWPGWSREVLELLYDERGIRASGHDTTDTDPGIVVSDGKAPLERSILARDRYQIELLANLENVPANGAIVVATWPKPRGGSGFPARVFAISP